MNYLKKIFNNEKEFPYEIDEISHLEYPTGTLMDSLEEIINKYPNNDAIEYYGKKTTYYKFYKQIVECAKSLKQIGVEKGDRITICMPNTPEAIIMFYAVNMIGAVSSMIHPFSSVNEIEYYLETSKSKCILTIDLFQEKVIEAARKVKTNKIIITSATDSMFMAMKYAFNIYTEVKKYFNQEKNTKYSDEDILYWKEFISLGKKYHGKYKNKGNSKDEAVILYSGGTTGKPKGVRLSNLNFNALAKQCLYITGAKPKDGVLVILPIFHGFGLAVSIHTPLINGCKCVLIPKFNANEFAKLIKRHKPSFLTGVPTMYEALTQNSDNSKYLKSVKNVICGGDLLQPELREKVNKYLLDHGSSAQIRVGYGLTESTAACILMPRFFYKEGIIGKALPDNDIKIFKENTTKEIKNNKVGEICVSGPTVMLGYLNEEEETRNTLKLHEDGKIWLHTGDLGYKDKEGNIYFKSRLKRMIITSGYNIYPGVMEKIMKEHPAIENVVVIGIPHPYKKQVPVACIVLKKNHEKSSELTEDIKHFCEKSMAIYSMPYKYHYIKSIPKTLIGKINYKKLEEECRKKYEKKK